jgi:hypothetical protein
MNLLLFGEASIYNEPVESITTPELVQERIKLTSGTSARLSALPMISILAS